jgi:hypothetical protein
MKKKFKFVHQSDKVKEIFTAEIIDDFNLMVSWGNGQNVKYAIDEAEYYLQTGAWVEIQ